MNTESEDRAQLIADLKSDDDIRIIEAAKRLLAIGDYGTPAGIVCLAGGKAALRKWKTADAVVLLYRGLKVVTPRTALWGDLLVNRATACAHHGHYPDAIEAGEVFLQAVDSLPPGAERWVPFVHHAVGLAYHRMRDPQQAAYHYRMAAEKHWVPRERADALCDLAYAEALCGHPDKGDEALARVDQGVFNALGVFGYHATCAVVLYFQRRYDEALSEARKAEELAQGKEDEWAIPLTELHIWLSKIYWGLGDRYHAGAWGLHAAVHAEMKRLFALADEANNWLQEIMEQGGVRGDA
ncbi:MAG TPA: hypothetical protein VGK74_23350 [Symbiobacteriaceae bacterium]